MGDRNGKVKPVSWDKDSLLRRENKYNNNNNNSDDNSTTTNNVYKQVMHNAIAHHPLTDAQPNPEQSGPPPPG